MQAEIIHLFYLGIETIAISRRLGLKVAYVTETINWYLNPSVKDNFEIFESAMNFT